MVVQTESVLVTSITVRSNYISITRAINCVEFVYQLLISILFLAGAVSDILKREVRDELSILLWLLCAYSVDLQLMIVSFCLLWAIAVLGEKLKMKIFGWGDVIWSPAFIAASASMVGFNTAMSLFGLCFVAGQMYLHWQYKIKKLTAKDIRGVPFLLCLAAAFVVAIILATK